MFLEKRGLTLAGKILYILPVKSHIAAKINADAQGKFFVISSADLHRTLSRSYRLSLLLSYFSQYCIFMLFKRQNAQKKKLAPFRYTIQSVFEYKLCESMSLRTFVTSNSAHTIYNAKFAYCSILGLKTVLWQYAGVGVIPYLRSMMDENPKYVGRFAQSCFACSDVFVWSRQDAEIFKKRQIKRLAHLPIFKPLVP